MIISIKLLMTEHDLQQLTPIFTRIYMRMKSIYQKIWPQDQHIKMDNEP